MRRGSGFSLAPVGSLAARQGATMAHRRRVMRGRKGLVALGLVSLAAVLAAAIHVSNEVTTLRRHIASLEALRRCADAEGALLLADWNNQTSLPVLTTRAQAELGLEVAATPGLTLIAVSQVPSRPQGRIDRFLGNFGGGAAMAADMSSETTEGAMISLEPVRHDPKERS